MSKNTDDKYIPHSIEAEYDQWENSEEIIDRKIEIKDDFDREIDDYD